MNNEQIMSAEEFFGEPAKDKTPARTGNARGKRSNKDLFTELKIKMVMRIYGVSRARAMEIIVGRADERQEMERAKESLSACSRRRPSDDEDEELMSAADFFGED